MSATKKKIRQTVYHIPRCIASLRDPRKRTLVSETVILEDNIDLKNDLENYVRLNLTKLEMLDLLKRIIHCMHGASESRHAECSILAFN